MEEGKGMNSIKKIYGRLILCVCALLLAGCAKKSKSGNVEWRMADCEVCGLTGAVMDIALISGQEFYALSGSVSEGKISQHVYQVDLNAKKAKQIPLEIDADNYAMKIVSLDENKMAFLLSEMPSDEMTAKCSMMIADQTGQVISRREMPEVTDSDEVLRLLFLNGRIVLITSNCVFSMDGNLADIKELKTETRIADAAVVDEERIIFLCNDEPREDSIVKFHSLNLKEETWEKDFTLRLDNSEPVTRLMDGRGSSFYLISTKNIYECEEKGSINPILRLDELNLSTDEQRILTTLPEKGFLGAMVDFENDKSTIGILDLVETEEGQIQIVIGGVGMDEGVISKLLTYNQTHTDIKVKIKEYEFDKEVKSSYQDACNRLYADILGGNGPDIICMQGLNYRDLVKMGYLENLDTFYDNDPEISKSDLIPSLRDAITVDGSIYFLVPEFSITTLAGKTCLVGDSAGWTMKELYDCWKTNQCVLFSWSSSSMFRLISTGMVQNENIAMEDYKLALEMSKKETDINANERNASLKNGEALLAYCGVTQPSFIQAIHAAFDEKDIMLKGFPDVEGSGALFNIRNSFGISSKSKQKKAAWSVIRTLMKEDYQTIFAKNLSFFPSRLDCFEDMLLEYAKEESEYNEWLGKEISFYEDKIIVTALSWEDVNRIKEMVFETKQVSYEDTEFSKIVNEEANAYFSGDKDIDVVCEVIKNRMELYHKEE